MKKALFLFILSFLSINLHAQKKFIEITVSDTFSLKPVKIFYTIKDNAYISTDWSTELDANGKKGAENRTARETLSDEMVKTETLLKKNNYVYKQVETTQSYSDVKTKDLVVELNSVTELKKLEGQLNEAGGLTGKVTHINFEPEDSYLKNLFIKLTEKAKTQAGLLAAATQLKLGNVISVSETGSNSGGMMDYYTALIETFAKSEDMIAMLGPDLTKSYKRSFTFKFAAE